MFVMAILDGKFSQGQRDITMDYLKSLKANNAIEVSRQFHPALSKMVISLAAESPILLGAHAALWEAFKNANREPN
jgi:hypothetical protein